MPTLRFRLRVGVRWSTTDSGGMARALTERKQAILTLQRKLGDCESLL
jgi:hypothetical protein